MATFSTRTRTLTELVTAVRDARIAAGMSQTELASAANLKRSWVSLFEGGHLPNASLSRVLALCDALRIDIRVTYPIPDREPGTAGPAERGHEKNHGNDDDGVEDVPELGASTHTLDPVALATARAQRAAQRARALADEAARGGGRG